MESEITKLKETENRQMAARGGGWVGERGEDEGGQNMQTPNYEINEFKTLKIFKIIKIKEINHTIFIV